MLNAWNAGQVPILSWDPYPGENVSDNPCRHDPRRTYPTKIANPKAKSSKELDDYLTTISRELLNFLKGPDGVWGTDDDRRMYLSIGSEMNGKWRKWYSPGPLFKTMHRNIVDRVRSVLPRDDSVKTHLQIIWTVNNVDVGKKERTAESFYPGDNYVDWVGVDGYNWAGKKYKWQSPKTAFGSMIRRLKKIGKGKPLAVVEIGVGTKAGVKKKNKWIADALKYLKGRKVRLLSWFNQNKETDWTVFGKVAGNKSKKIGKKVYRYYSAWTVGMKNKYFIGSSPMNKRLVSDAAFLGK